MITILAEKPSVARDIAANVGATNKADGYLYGNGYSVTWAFGHLVQLAMPEDYGVIGFNRENLPIIPDNFKLIVRKVRDGKSYKNDAGAEKQIRIIDKLFKECDFIIVATDAGREGELIFRYIYDYLGCDKLFQRLWISSLTDSAIRDGLNNLKDGADYDNLYLAARSRSEADWLVGINASQALTLSAGGGVFSLGRVQTPTLAMICERYRANKSFTPCTNYTVDIEFENGIVAVSERLFDDKELAVQVSDAIQNVVIANIETKEITENPPLFYDLTTLQKDANKQYGYSAQETLNVAQTLYERKLITYPRTGSRYISEDMYYKLQIVVMMLSSSEDWKICTNNIDPEKLNRQCVDNSKVTDHHAILITSETPNNLTELEQNIYNMIGLRIIEAIMPKCKKTSTTITAECNNEKYIAKIIEIKEIGWRGVRDKNPLPTSYNDFVATDSYNPWCIQGQKVNQRITKPKAIHTESSLLSAMENAGKNEGVFDGFMDLGLGTPATRASTIETLLSRGYIVREGKSLVPTQKGLVVYDAVKEMRIANVLLTGEWENGLCSIERGELDCQTFNNVSREYTRRITDELLSKQIVIISDNDFICPKCGSKSIHIYDKVVKCRGEGCDFVIFRDIASKHLSDKQIAELLTKGKTTTIKGFKSKFGKSFDAALTLDDKKSVLFQTGKSKKGNSKSK
ncbi:MAG: DNA topoisomerase [Rikenellaceae bacterium]